MRRILLLITACLALTTAQAQDSLTVCKFGYFSYGQVLQSMPQYAIVQKQLTTLREQYDAELKRVEDEFNRKYEEFLEGQRDFPKTILQKRQNELQELMTRNIAFKENSRQELAKAEKEAMAPLRLQLNDLLITIGIKYNYAFILDTDSNTLPFIHPDMGVDITEMILGMMNGK